MHPKVVLTAFACLTLAGIVGFPVVELCKAGFWLSVLAAASCVVLGLTRVAESLVPWAAGCGVAGMVLHALVGAGRGALSDPRVLLALGMVFALVVLACMAFLLGKAALTGHVKRPKPRYGVGERVVRADPIPLDRVLGRVTGSGERDGRRAARRGIDHDQDDDLGIFSRRRS